MIITNNPDVKEAALLETELVKGTPLDVLRRVSELLDQGLHLVSAPLAANNRLNRSPYRSVIVGPKNSWTGDERDLLDRAISHLALQGFVDPKNADADYRWIDLEHLRTAVEEAKSYRVI